MFPITPHHTTTTTTATRQLAWGGLVGRPTVGISHEYHQLIYGIIRICLISLSLLFQGLPERVSTGNLGDPIS